MWPRPTADEMATASLGHVGVGRRYLGLRRVYDASSPEATRCRPLRGLCLIIGVDRHPDPGDLFATGKCSFRYVSNAPRSRSGLHVVALNEGLCLIIGVDRRPDPFRQMIVSVRGCPRFQPAETGPNLSNERQLALSPRKRAAAFSHGRKPMVNGCPAIQSRERGDSREQPSVGSYQIRSAKRCGLGQRRMRWRPHRSAMLVLDVATSGYVASTTLPHPRLHAVALFEGCV
jgi:hypothetical protein